MSIRAVLCINRREYRVLRYRQRFARRVSSNGMPASDLYGGTIDVEFESERDSGIFALMTDENTPTIEGYLRISPSEEDTMVRELKFDEAYLVGYSEQQYDDWGAPVTMCVSISPIRLDFNRTVCIERRNSSIWREYRAEKPLFKAPVHTPPSPLVTSVKGEDTALPTHTVKYSVTGYNLATIGTNDRERVKWLVRVDGRDELLSQRGETLELTIKPEWTGKDVTVMPYLRKPNEEVSVKTTVKDTMHYVVIPQKGSIEKDFSKTPQMNQYRINNRSASELTIQRLKREISFDSSAVREAIRKITDDYNTKYTNGFPDDYYVIIGKLLFVMIKQENRQIKLPKYVHTSIVLELACILVDGDKGFGGGKGAPLFHIYENVVRKNDDTGIDKLLHFLYSAKYAYVGGSTSAKVMGFLKEFFADEMYSWFSDDKGWDNLDMEANKKGIEFGRSLPKK